MNSLLRFSVPLHLAKGTISLLLILCITGIQSQILYTDIEDTILTFPENIPGELQNEWNFFHIDLDQDGENDFTFGAHYWEEWYTPSANEYPYRALTVRGLYGATIAHDTLEYCLIPFMYDDTIQSVEWHTYGVFYYSGDCDPCNSILPYEDKYLGLRLNIDSEYYYGWISLDAETHKLTFRDFAYNTVSDATIMAGHTNSADIADINTNETRISFDGSSLHFEAGIFGQYMIYSIDGKAVEKKNTPADGILDIQHLSPGFYIITLIGPNAVVSKKISRK